MVPFRGQLKGAKSAQQNKLKGRRQPQKKGYQRGGVRARSVGGKKTDIAGWMGQALENGIHEMGGGPQPEMLKIVVQEGNGRGVTSIKKLGGK